MQAVRAAPVSRRCTHAHLWGSALKVLLRSCAGIWGGKGQGKTFQCNLAFKKLGIGPIVMSAGELESGNAGEPAKLIRQRYREASDVIKKGKMCAPRARRVALLSLLWCSA